MKSVEDRLADIERRLDAIEAGKAKAATLEVHVSGHSVDHHIRMLARQGAEAAIREYPSRRG